MRIIILQAGQQAVSYEEGYWQRLKKPFMRL
jgi:hypothetical protein